MIIDRKKFDLNNKCVIEKLLIETPFRYGAIFQNEACFLFIKEGDARISSPTENLNICVSESVLLKCGSYFADIVHKPGSRICEILAIHLHKDILLGLYKNELPGFIRLNNKEQFAEKIERQDIIIHFVDSLEFYFQHPDLVNDELLKLKLKVFSSCL